MINTQPQLLRKAFEPVPASVIVGLLTTHRLPLADEKLLQLSISDIFEAAGDQRIRATVGHERAGAAASDEAEAF